MATQSDVPVAARLHRLRARRLIEFYDLFFTAYVAPGRSDWAKDFGVDRCGARRGLGRSTPAPLRLWRPRPQSRIEGCEDASCVTPTARDASGVVRPGSCPSTATALTSGSRAARAAVQVFWSVCEQEEEYRRPGATDDG